MRRTVAIAGLMLLATAGVAWAQDEAVDVRTWNGQALRLTAPSLEVFYTIVPTPKEGVVAAPTLSSSQTQVGGSSTTTAGLQPQPGAVRPVEGYQTPQGVDSKQGRRQQTSLTLAKEGVSMTVPLATVKAMTFAREPVKSTLPPYLQRDHYRYSATVDLADGSQVAGASVNLGTAVLRGTTPQGTVDIPWQDIQTLRFQR